MASQLLPSGDIKYIFFLVRTFSASFDAFMFVIEHH